MAPTLRGRADRSQNAFGADRLPAGRPCNRGQVLLEMRTLCGEQTHAPGRSVHLGDQLALADRLVLADQQPDLPGRGRQHLCGHLVDHHLGEQLPARHLVAVADEPGGERRPRRRAPPSTAGGNSTSVMLRPAGRGRPASIRSRRRQDRVLERPRVRDRHVGDGDPRAPGRAAGPGRSRRRSPRSRRTGRTTGSPRRRRAAGRSWPPTSRIVSAVQRHQAAQVDDLQVDARRAASSSATSSAWCTDRDSGHHGRVACPPGPPPPCRSGSRTAPPGTGAIDARVLRHPRQAHDALVEHVDDRVVVADGRDHQALGVGRVARHDDLHAGQVRERAPQALGVLRGVASSRRRPRSSAPSAPSRSRRTRSGSSPCGCRSGPCRRRRSRRTSARRSGASPRPRRRCPGR